MNLLGAKLYDPSSAVSKSTASLLAMTAFDTTNLRVAVTIPAHGMVYVRVMGGAVTGATTVPTILLGVLNGSTVLARITPQDFPGTMNATTQSCPLYAEFVITGLTPGAMNLDLAYGVEVIVAATNIKYGGPNNTTTNDAWGGISFQVWDPQPNPTNFGLLSVDANGRIDVIKIAGTTQTARDVGAQLDAAVSSRMATYTQPTGFLAATFPASVASPTNITAGTITTVTNLTNAPTAGDLTATMKTSVTTAATAATPVAASVTGAVGSVTGNVGGNVVGSVASVTAAVSVTGDLSATMKASVTTAASAATPTAAAVTGNIGGNVLGSVAGNVAGSVGSVVGLTASNLDTTVSSRLASASYTAPDNTSVTAIKAKTDSLAFTVAGEVDANIKSVNDTSVTGSGSGAAPWGP